MAMVLLRLLLTFNATSLLLIIYQVKQPFLFVNLDSTFQFWLSAALVLIPVALTRISITLCQRLGSDSLNAGSIDSVEHANNAFLPSYLGYFFVALSIPNIETLGFVYVILFTFTFVSQALYFNPIFLVFGYKFYNVVTTKGTSLFVISQQNFRAASKIQVDEAVRINGYTYLEVRRNGSHLRENKTATEKTLP